MFIIIVSNFYPLVFCVETKPKTQPLFPFLLKVSYKNHLITNLNFAKFLFIQLLSQTKELHDKLVSEFENLLDEQDNENEEEQLESDIGNPEDEESDDEVIISKNIKKKTNTSVKNKTKKAVQKVLKNT